MKQIASSSALPIRAALASVFLFTLLSLTAREAEAEDAAIHTVVDFVCGEQRRSYEVSSIEISIGNELMSGSLINVAPGTHNLRILTSTPGWLVKEIKYLDAGGGRELETYNPNVSEVNLPLVFTARSSRSYTSSLNILIETCASAAPSSACALTPQEEKLAAAAFLKLVPVLEHDRCALCHGRQDVFAKGTAHAGGRFFDAEEVIVDKWRVCAGCHNAAQTMAGTEDELQWRQAMTDATRWADGSLRQLCVAMKFSRKTSQEFIAHLKDDVRLTLAFEGKRGHIELPAEPPPLTHANFLAAAQQWVNALGGEKNWRPEVCGCETLTVAAPVVPPGGGGTGAPPAAGGPPAQPAPTPIARDPAFEYDVYRSGHGYRDFELPTADPNLCAAQCAQEAQCKAWTYLKPGVQADLARCWLKDAVTAPVSSVTFAISGVTRAGGAAP